MSGIAIDPILANLLLDIVRDLFQVSELTRVLSRGFSFAALFVMIGVGLSLIFGLMGVLNFAHGTFVMLGAYIGGAFMLAALTVVSGEVVSLILFFLAIAFVFALLTALGSAIEVSMIRPIYDRQPLFQILLTFGIVLVLDELARIVVELYGRSPGADWREPGGTMPDLLSGELLPFIDRLQVFEVLVGAAVVMGTWWFLNETRYGLYIRAGSEESEMVEALGINIRQAFTVVFGVGSGLAGVAGVMLMWDPRFAIQVPLSTEALLIAFVVVIIGGLGTFRGTVVASVLTGVLFALMQWVFANHVAYPGLPEMSLFLVMVLVLIVRPQGLLGVEEVGGH